MLIVYMGQLEKAFTSTHLLIQHFDVGVNEDGYWRHDHMSLQHEDVYDVLNVVYPDYDFVILPDQSSGHGKRDDDALHALCMSVKWEGQQGMIHPTEIKEVGPFPSLLKVGQIQHMIFVPETPTIL